MTQIGQQKEIDPIKQYCDKQRELFYELKGLTPFCFVCQLSQEKRKCEVMIDMSKCRKDICTQCFKTRKNDICEICTQKMEQHFKKTKLSQKNQIYDEASKIYNREKNIRSNEDYQTLQFDFVNLMCYFNAHPHVSVRKKYQQIEKEVKKILQNKKKDQRTLISQNSKVKQAKIIQKHIEDNQDNICTGLQSCGYNRRYQKGINLLRMGWGYQRLQPEEFTQCTDLIRRDEIELKQQTREQQLIRLKLRRQEDEIRQNE